MTMLSSFPRGTQALVTGASRGLGLGFVTALLSDGRVGRVYAGCRTPAAAAGLHELSARHAERLQILELDVGREDTLRAAAEVLRGEAGGGKLHLLLNVAGVLHDALGMRPERRLEDVDAQAVMRGFQVNALGPLLAAKHLAPLMLHGGRAAIVNLSARVGSIGDNRLGGWYAYRGAKSAQNQFTRTLAVELARKAPNLVVLALHPGTVATDLSAPFRGNVAPEKLFGIDRAVAQMIAVIDSRGREHSGRFFAWDGSEIPW